MKKNKQNNIRNNYSLHAVPWIRATDFGLEDSEFPASNLFKLSDGKLIAIQSVRIGTENILNVYEVKRFNSKNEGK